MRFSGGRCRLQALFGINRPEVPQPVGLSVATVVCMLPWSRDLCSGYPAEYGDSIILVPPEAAELK